MDEVFHQLRKIIIFDNLVIYKKDPTGQLIVLCGKAVGRGKNAGADIAWGEKIASQIFEKGEIFVDNPTLHESENRLDQPYYLGVPILRARKCMGVLIFIRFGSPPFNPSESDLAVFISDQISILLDRQALEEELIYLQGQRQQVQTREDFISNITHELRTPLGGIKGYTTTLLRSDTTWDKATEQEFLQIIDKEADYLQQLIDNLLDSTRLSAGLLKMHFNQIRIDGVIRDAAAHIHLTHPDLKIKMSDADHIEPIDGDANRLNQVFINLFINVIKYAPESEISVRIIQEPEYTTVSVQDFGPGIPEEYLPFIFNRFFRNPELSPNVHGTGLGLFICQQIIQAHRGEIKAESERGNGTCFIIKLPNIQS